jgi:DNA relaxase NicK
VDWFGGTFPDPLTPAEVFARLGLELEQTRQLERGQNGYRQGLAWGDVRVYFDGNPGMGVNVQMSGDACREYEQKHGAGCWTKLFGELLAAGGHATRLDLAIDDHTQALDLTTMERHPIRSRIKNGARVVAQQDKDGNRNAATLYYGEPTSMTMVRFYDKQAQKGTDFPWVRCELQLRKDRAQTAMQLLHAGMQVGELVVCYLKGHLTFVEPNPADTNRARWDAAAWWESWLGDVERLSLVVQGKVAKTIEEAKGWVMKQLAPTLATIRRGISPTAWATFLQELDLSGQFRMRDKHWAMLAAPA